MRSIIEKIGYFRFVLLLEGDLMSFTLESLYLPDELAIDFEQVLVLESMPFSLENNSVLLLL